MVQCQILGLGTNVPPHEMSQQQAAELACQLGEVDQRGERTVRVLYRKAGVQHRRTCVPYQTARQFFEQSQNDHAFHPSENLAVESAAPGTATRMQWFSQHAPGLALKSAQGALSNSQLDPISISHLVTVCCTGFSAPGIDIHLMRELGLPATTQRIQVGFMGCHGAINGLRVAQAICESNPQANVLLNATEVCSIHYHFEWGSERLVGNSLFGDGSASAVLSANFANSNCHTPRVQLRDTGSCLVPDSVDAMAWEIGDLGFEMRLSAKIPELIEQHLGPWLESWLAQRGESIDSIAHWVIHPGGPRVLDAVTNCMNLPEDAVSTSRAVLRDHGNMSSPTVLFVLERALATQRPGSCVILGFGPGLVAEVALLHVS